MPPCMGPHLWEAVDVSREALDMLSPKRCLQRRGRRRLLPSAPMFFDLVKKEYSEAGRQYDLVICDPPAFAKSKGAPSGRPTGIKAEPAVYPPGRPADVTHLVRSPANL